MALKDALEMSPEPEATSSEATPSPPAWMLVPSCSTCGRVSYLPFHGLLGTSQVPISQQLTAAEINVLNTETSHSATPHSVLISTSHHSYRKPQDCERDVKITQGMLRTELIFFLINLFKFEQSCCAVFPVFPLTCCRHCEGWLLI